MYIHEAINETTDKQPFITRNEWKKEAPNADLKVRPTDTPDCCIIQSKLSKSPCRGWQPTERDLMADDWETTD